MFKLSFAPCPHELKHNASPGIFLITDVAAHQSLKSGSRTRAVWMQSRDFGSPHLCRSIRVENSCAHLPSAMIAQSMPWWLLMSEPRDFIQIVIKWDKINIHVGYTWTLNLKSEQFGHIIRNMPICQNHLVWFLNLCRLDLESRSGR